MSVVFVGDPFVVKSCTATNYGVDDEDYDEAEFRELKLIDQW